MSHALPDKAPAWKGRVSFQLPGWVKFTLPLTPFYSVAFSPGKPTENGHIESFNGRFRDECLNDHWFTTLAEARILIAAWRQDYNQCRPHSTLSYQTPAEFAAKHRVTTPASLLEKERL